MDITNLIPTDAWNSSTTAQGLNQLEQHTLAWNQVFGNYPKELKLKTSLFFDLMTQTSTKQALRLRMDLRRLLAIYQDYTSQFKL